MNRDSSNYKAVGHSPSGHSSHRTPSPQHDESCGLDIAGQRPNCPACAAMGNNEAAGWPGRGEWISRDLELFKKLGLPRIPCTLDHVERRLLLIQLLDLERTLRRYPAWANEFRAILKGIFGR